MAGKTLAELMAMTRRLCGETDGDMGLFESEDGLKDFINSEYFNIFTEIVEKNSDIFARPSADLTLSSAGIDLSATTVHANGVFKVSGVDYKDPASGDYYILDPVNRREGLSGWYIENFVLRMGPRLDSSITIRLWYTPNPSAMSSSTDKPFESKMPTFHGVIAYMAAVNALDKDHASGVLVRSAERSKKMLMDYVSSVQTALPRRILNVDRSYNEDFVG